MSEHIINLDALKYDIEQGGHSVFSPSGSAMWLTCSGSLLPNLVAPDNAGEDAAYGTVAHGVAEEWLISGVRPDHRVGEVVQIAEGRTVFDITIDNEMMEYVAQSVEWAQSLPGDLYIEKKVYFSQLTPIPKQGGTMDVGAFEHTVMRIFDHKFGKGVQVFAATHLDDPRSIIVNEDGTVYANGNTQAMLYALGALYEYDWIYGFQRIIVYISQPRLNHFQTWETTKDELLKFAEWVKVRAFLAWQKGASRTPSEKGCRFCKVKSTCPALVALMNKLTDDVFDDLDAEVTSEQAQDAMLTVQMQDTPKLLPVEHLTTEQLSRLLPYRSMFEKWFTSLEEELLNRALNGAEIPGMKLVEARSNRKWNVAEQRAVDELMFLGVKKGDMYSTDFLSPAKAETALVKAGMRKNAAEKVIAKLVAKAPGKATLAPVADTREKLGQVADDCFDDLDL